MSTSRLPRLLSSPDNKSYIPSTITTRTRTHTNTGTGAGSSTLMASLKRKAAQQDEDEDFNDGDGYGDEALDQPRKLPAIGSSGSTRPNRPLQPSRTATNLAKSGPSIPKPLTKPRAPMITRSTIRGTSAPPQSSGLTTRGQPARPTTAARNPPGRVASGSGPPRATAAGGPPGRATSSDDKRFTSLQTQLHTLESARLADAARLAADMSLERAKVADLQANHLALSRELAQAKTQELTQRRELVNASDEIEALRKRYGREVMELEMDVKKREREVREVTEDLRVCRGDLERERETVSALKSTISSQATTHLTLTTQNQALQAQMDAYLRTVGDLTSRLESAEKEVEEMKKEVVESERIRRRLHNMVQELKGNIRVFCRVRPVLPSDLTGEEEGIGAEANMVFPDQRDHKEIVLSSSSESATGQERKEVYNFGFDRVFEPRATQAEVFEEISQLAQSCTDGYNVCIFAYGQTGSGKSFTMEGGSTPETAGMIPRAVEQVFRVAEEMKAKGWEYSMEGQFLEIYNETITDLLNAHDFDKKKHEIKHDPKTGSTKVTDATVLPLRNPEEVRVLLGTAQGRRRVAATMVNERSSRSHSVFTLRISGVHVGVGGEGEAGNGTGERCEGSLNLVDLAGSERLNVSFANGADKERVKETQSINKSLSALGDVIAALGEKGAAGGEAGKHIPYRNSKLTYLLQNSLSGNSKTLMFLNLSPLAAHLNESLTSLRFATKVNNTTIGTAKKQSRPRDS